VSKIVALITVHVNSALECRYRRPCVQVWTGAAHGCFFLLGSSCILNFVPYFFKLKFRVNTEIAVESNNLTCKNYGINIHDYERPQSLTHTVVAQNLLVKCWWNWNLLSGRVAKVGVLESDVPVNSILKYFGFHNLTLRMLEN